jgi:hypothetical protein
MSSLLGGVDDSHFGGGAAFLGIFRNLPFSSDSDD